MQSHSMQTMSEVQKVWHRVMSIKYRAGNRAVKIPSSNELAKEFGIARSTVRIALEGLREEGVLITRVGSGTFINPKKSFNTVWESPLIGLMILDCNMFFYPPEIQGELECLLAGIRHTGWNIRNVTGHMANEKDAEDVIVHNYLDGVITFGSPEHIVRVADSMLPTVNMGLPVEGVANVISGCTCVVKELLDMTESKETINVWTAFMESSRQPLFDHLRTIPNVKISYSLRDRYCVDDQYLSLLKQQFAQQCPDWIFIHPNWLEPIRNIIIDLYGESRARKILWVYMTVVGTDRDWPGYNFRSNRKVEVQMAIEMLSKKLVEAEVVVSDVVVEAELLKME